MPLDRNLTVVLFTTSMNVGTIPHAASIDVALGMPMDVKPVTENEAAQLVPFVESRVCCFAFMMRRTVLPVVELNEATDRRDGSTETSPAKKESYL